MWGSNSRSRTAAARPALPVCAELPLRDRVPVPDQAGDARCLRPSVADQPLLDPFGSSALMVDQRSVEVEEHQASHGTICSVSRVTWACSCHACSW